MTSKQDTRRFCIRAAFVGSTREEIKEAIACSNKMHDGFRAKVLKEMLEEGRENQGIRLIHYDIDLEHGSVEVGLEYRYEDDEVEILGIAEWGGSSDAVGEIIEAYIRNEPSVFEDIEDSIRANEWLAE